MARRIRVLMTVDASEGVWNVNVDLIVGLRARGVDVTLAVLGPPPAEAQAREALERGIAFHHAPFRLEWTDDPWNDLAAASGWLRELEENIGSDLVHLNGLVLGDVPFRGPRLLVAHSCLLSWWTAVNGTAPPSGWDRYRQMVRRGLEGTPWVVAPSAWMRDQLHRHYTLDPRLVTVIHHGRSGVRFAPHHKRSFVFASGSIWDEGKNIRTLARVSRHLLWPVEVAGLLSTYDGSTPRPLVDQLTQVDFLGLLSTDEMARMYAAASIYAHPARYEPFGLSVLEAALSECALVLGDVPSLRELWEGAATFVPPNDGSELARAIANLIDYPDRRQELARRARHRAQAYTVESMIGAYVALYARMLSTPEGVFSLDRKENSCVS